MKRKMKMMKRMRGDERRLDLGGMWIRFCTMRGRL